MKNSEFFDSISDNYDEMINFEKSLINKTESFKNFISNNYKYALDLGCGTAADSIALSKLGLIVDAVDQSQGMLAQARKNSERFNTNINFIQSNLTDFSIRNKSYDLIVSLGNTLANLHKNELGVLLKNLHYYLNADGKIVIQIINYSILPKSGKYLLNEYENDFVSITRKYEINPDNIDFIIDTTNKSNNETSTIITKLYPHSAKDFKLYANENNLKIDLFESLKKEKFIDDESKNLIIIMSK